MTSERMDVGAVFLDFDGVLVDSEKLWWDEIERVLGARGVLAEGERITKRIAGLPLEEALRQTQPQGLLAADVISELACDVRERVEPEIAKLTIPTSEATAIRRISAESVVVGVVSSSSTALLRAFLLHNALDGEVSVVVGGDRVQSGKPAPEIYLLAADEANANPHRCCVLEDSEAGLRAAQRAGMYPVQYVNSPDRRAHGIAATAVGSIAELADLVLGAGLPR